MVNDTDKNTVYMCTYEPCCRRVFSGEKIEIDKSTRWYSAGSVLIYE